MTKIGTSNKFKMAGEAISNSVNCS